MCISVLNKTDKEKRECNLSKLKNKQIDKKGSNKSYKNKLKNNNREKSNIDNKLKTKQKDGKNYHNSDKKVFNKVKSIHHH